MPFDLGRIGMFKLDLVSIFTAEGAQARAIERLAGSGGDWRDLTQIVTK